jgi:AraC-like DNA-binding protein/ligand-binding sensor protein
MYNAMTEGETNLPQIKDRLSMGSIISKREIKPLLSKAGEVLRFYELAAGCGVSVVDHRGHIIDSLEIENAVFFCSLCRRFCSDTGRRWEEDEYPCTMMHIKALRESIRLGGSYIYTCKLGFVYWTSPIYSGGRYAGSLMAGRIIGIKREKMIKNIYELCKGTIAENRIAKYLMGIPERSLEEITAQAQLLLICAQKISTACEEYRPPSSINGRPNIQLVESAVRRENRNGGNLLDKERLLMASLRRGDNKTGIKILGEILQNPDNTSPGNFEFLRLRAIELVVLLSRAAVYPENDADSSILEANDRYLKQISETRTAKELKETLKAIMERMSGNIFNFQGIRHSSALRKAERFIWGNYTRKISLQEIADASGLSAPYFSTIFKEETGENLSAYLNRLRIEKAMVMLTETSLTLNEIAEASGFEDQSWFSKIFKNYTGISPGKYRETGGAAPFPIQQLRKSGTLSNGKNRR